METPGSALHGLRGVTKSSSSGSGSHSASVVRDSDVRDSHMCARACAVSTVGVAHAAFQLVEQQCARLKRARAPRARAAEQRVEEGRRVRRNASRRKPCRAQRRATTAHARLGDGHVNRVRLLPRAIGHKHGEPAFTNVASGVGVTRHRHARERNHGDGVGDADSVGGGEEHERAIAIERAQKRVEASAVARCAPPVRLRGRAPQSRGDDGDGEPAAPARTRGAQR